MWVTLLFERHLNVSPDEPGLVPARMWICIPVADVDARGGLTASDDEGLHDMFRVNICTLQVRSWRPGVCIVPPIGKQNYEGRCVLRDRELNDLIRALHSLRAFHLKAEGHGQVELAWVANVTRDLAMRQIFSSDIHIESLVGVGTIAKQDSRRVTQPPSCFLPASQLTGNSIFATKPLRAAYR